MDTQGGAVSALGNIRERGVCMCVSGERALFVHESGRLMIATLMTLLAMAPGMKGPRKIAHISVVAGWRISPELVQQRIEELGEVARMKDGVEGFLVSVNRTGRLEGDEEDTMMASLAWSVSIGSMP